MENSFEKNNYQYKQSCNLNLQYKSSLSNDHSINNITRNVKFRPKKTDKQQSKLNCLNQNQQQFWQAYNNNSQLNSPKNQLQYNNKLTLENSQIFSHEDKKNNAHRVNINQTVFWFFLITSFLLPQFVFARYLHPQNSQIQQSYLNWRFGIYLFLITSFNISAIICTINIAKQLKSKEKCLSVISFYIMMDGILVAVTCLIIVQGFLSYIVDNPYDKVTISYQAVSYFPYAGNFRMLIKHYDWKRWQVITYKFIFWLHTAVYMFLGCFGIIKFWNDQSLFGEYVVICTLTYFTVFLQFLSKLGDFDGTANLQARYMILSPGQEEDQFYKDEEIQKENQKL